MDEFKAGDVVRLKSGGPDMTIEHIGKYSTKDGAKCVWFEGKKQCEEIFELATLCIATPVSGQVSLTR